MSSATSYEQFVSIYPKVESTILDDLQSHELPETVIERVRNALRANLLGGKLNRGMFIPDSISVLLGKSLSDEEYSEAAILGWTVELLQAYFLVHDDIMDGSSRRRGKPCWYLMEGVGLAAINDACLLESAAFLVLKKYFCTHPNYVAMLELFHDSTMKTEVGQLIDLLVSSEKESISTKFTMQAYRTMVAYKTAHYSFYLPVGLALFLSNRATLDNVRQAKDILLFMGEYFQIQDDFLDNFGSVDQIGKVGTDIIENKCTWLIVQALEIADDEQRKIIETNYGKNDEASEACIQKMYLRLGLRHRFYTLSAEYEQEIQRRVGSLDSVKGLPQSLFLDIWRKIYNRSK